MRLARLSILPLLLVIAACTVKLLPDRDEAIYNGLNSANQKAQTLFSALSGGSPKSAFARHGPAYDEVIGAFSALLNRAEARPAPAIGQALATKLKKIPRISSACQEIDEAAEGKDCLTLVTPRALNEIIETVSRLRDVHKAAGVKSLTLKAFLGDYDLSIEQALTIEGAL